MQRRDSQVRTPHYMNGSSRSATIRSHVHRNGGHITPALYHDYTALRKELGAEAAEHIMRFRLAHLNEFLMVADGEGLLDGSQCREVQTYDVFFDDPLFHEAKALLRKYLSELNSERGFWKILSRETAMKVSSTTCAYCSI